MKKIFLVALMSLMLLLVACNNNKPAEGGDAKKDETKEVSENKEAENKEAENKEAENKEENKEENNAADVQKLKVTVTTSFLEDMVRSIAGDFVEIEQIIPAGEDPHTYEPKPEDSNKLRNAELVFYHGLHFEGKMVEMLESVGAVAVTRNFDEAKLITMEEDGNTIVDPHFWFDIDLYRMAVKEAKEVLIEKIPAHAEAIEANYVEYDKALAALYEYGKTEIGSIPKETRYLVTPHDAFGYFSRTFDIEVKAPQGVSTDAELSTKDLAETADFIVEHKIKAIFAESTTDPARMKKLQESCKASGHEVQVVHGEGEELYSDSLAPKGEKGDTFVDMVKHNIDLIVKYLK